MTIYSFGWRHGKPDVQGIRLEIDVRKMLPKNPYHNRLLRQLRGDHPAVIAELEDTPGFEAAYQSMKAQVVGFQSEAFYQQAEHTMVWVGCTGGHHRSVYVANRLGKELGVPVIHRDYNKP